MIVDVSDQERLDVLMRSIRGCTFNEFMTKTYQARHSAINYLSGG